MPTAITDDEVHAELTAEFKELLSTMSAAERVRVWCMMKAMIRYRTETQVL